MVCVYKYYILQYKSEAMNIPEHIIAAHTKWMDAESKVPQYEYEKGYKSRSAKANKLYREFASLCELYCLKPVETSNYLTNGNKTTVTLKAK